MPVLVTAVKNKPSKRGSRLSRACSQTWSARAASAVGGAVDMEVRLASDRPPDSPDSDIDVWLEKQVRLPVAVAPLRASRARDFPIRGLRCRPLSSGWKNMRAV